jgi:hypothetical protein
MHIVQEMSDGAFTADHLRGLIGKRVSHRGLVCLVVEVLEDGPALVLQDCKGGPTIQPDQFGDAHRLAPRSLILPVRGPQGLGLNPEFLDLELHEPE